MFSNQIMLNLCEKICPKFYCQFCDYSTSKKSSFDNHFMSIKHKSIIGNQHMPKLCSEFICIKCNKIYKDNSGLWRHKKKCIIDNNNNDNNNDNNDNDNNNDNNNNNNNAKTKHHQEHQNQDITKKEDLIIMLLKQNADLMEIVKNGTHNTNNNTINNNSHNKAFNLNFFLNETCKNAMNITEFVDSIKLELSDLMELGEIGYVASMSKIITKNLNALDETARPIHCTDTKRETFYIKDEDKWEKEDDEMKRLRKLIFRLSNKTYKLVPKYREKYPDYNSASSIHSDEHCKIIIEAVTCDKLKDEKIIRNISKVTAISK